MNNDKTSNALVRIRITKNKINGDHRYLAIFRDGSIIIEYYHPQTGRMTNAYWLN